MSKERMNELHRLLESRGWRLMNSHQKFDVESEIVSWTLRKANTAREVKLDFCLFELLGNRTDNLDDILYCQVRDSGMKLYFDKIASKNWRRCIREFVAALDQCGTQRNE